ncbi:hypothetical protein [Bacillus infantis]|uniref:hypothetical protein n=1 Tax=Bacillus infantis TaxID=324767 RepID=UPI00321C178B
MKSKLDAFHIKHSNEEGQRRRAFGQRFIETRQKLGESIFGMSKLMGISKSTAERIERGQVSPDVPGLVKRLDQLENRGKIIIR